MYTVQSCSQTLSLVYRPECKKTLFTIMIVISSIEVAIHEARLGGMEEVMSCVKNADVLKTAADGLLKEIAGTREEEGTWEGL